MAADAETFFCARHHGVETVLRRGRCEGEICPKCVVFTDGGARCPPCARRRKLPQFEVGPVWLARGALAATAVGAVVGALWGLLLPGSFGLLGILVGAGVGYCVGEGVAVAPNRKAGKVLQTMAGIAAVFGFLVHKAIPRPSPLP